ncbi:MAG: malate dehydrogenase (quinone) [Akkermansiaceae bacterium]
MSKTTSNQALLASPDVTLIGGGIMSATLGIMLKLLRPELTIQIIESLEQVALESSQAWNNAGTGHAALCELNYTSEKADGSVDISKAINIFESFEESKQFWSFLIEQGLIDSPKDFIRRVPHMSFVRGSDNVDYLKNRHEAMSGHHFFQEMEYTTNHEVIKKWAPLLTVGRSEKEAIALTRVGNGTDIDFGTLTAKLISRLASMDGVQINVSTEVRDLSRNRKGGWNIKARRDGELVSDKISSKFVFIGAGGGSLPLLQKSNIPEGKGFGGFPVSGQFLVCNKQEIVDEHQAKVYGKAAVGAPPMSVPHLDTRVIDGKKALLFGPYAGFSPKFLKEGSLLDLIKSVKPDNLIPMLAVGKDNMSLTEYLYQEIMNSHTDRCDMLREFFPDAKDEDWDLVTAGQRVQIIKKMPEIGGKLQFGTEVVASADGSLAALLGASPGASTSVSIILEVLEKCFADDMKNEWANKLADLVPSYRESLASDAERFEELRQRSRKVLQLGEPIAAPV